MSNIIMNTSVYYTNSNLITTDFTNKILNQNNDEKTTESISSNSIELDSDKKNILNKIKAHDAMNEAFDQFGMSSEERINLLIEYGRMKSQMRHQGIDVPDFDLSNSNLNTASFLPFISKMKEFSENYFSTGDHLVSSNTLLNFLDKFEEQLRKHDCF